MPYDICFSVIRSDNPYLQRTPDGTINHPPTLSYSSSATVLPRLLSSIFSYPSALSLASAPLNPGLATARGADSAPHSASEAPGQDG